VAYNDRGVIAESYYDLQGLRILDAARECHPLPAASPESTLRAVLQAVEIALLNLGDIVSRASADIDQGTFHSATVKMFWARGFHRVIVRLSVMPEQLAFSDMSANGAVLLIEESPAFQGYVNALTRFDRAVLGQIRLGQLDLESTLAEGSLDSPQFNLLHLARITNHESTIWESNLAAVRVPALCSSYEEFVLPQSMREAVYDRVLKGDTFFTQFRGLHQIPETLGCEVADHLEQAIRTIRQRRLEAAAEHLRCVNILMEGILASVPPMADSLATSDYHRIRENLGLTSGSHSVTLRYHMFTHLYEQLWKELAIFLAGEQESHGLEEEALQAAGRAERRRFEDPQAWFVHLLIDYCLQLRTMIFQWREQHLHMPRNNLGGESTKSLTGSPDAIQAVKRMRNAAKAKDPMAPLARLRGLGAGRFVSPTQPLTKYLESKLSLDDLLLATTGMITQDRFKNVQERLGYFTQRSHFTAPPRRKA
jgi:tryptophan 2,3-dioxygenase